ncbi:MAG: alpha-2-macroglobulin [Alphaproteobacteria bacterium]
MSVVRACSIALLLLCGVLVSGAAQAFESPRHSAQASDYRERLLAHIEEQGSEQYGDAATWLPRGQQQLATNQLGEAIDSLEIAAGLGEDSHALWSALASAWRQYNYRSPQALSAQVNALRTAGTDSERRGDLVLVGELLESAEEFNLAIAAYQAAEAIASDPDLAERVAFLQQEHGFRALWVDVYADRDEPRACIQFSDPLPAGRGTDLSSYVRLEPAVPYELTVEGFSLCLNGLRHGESYNVTVRAGMPATDGDQRTYDDFTYALAVENRQPGVSFRGSAYVLPTGGAGTVPISTVNVDMVDVEVLRINDRNLVNQVIRDRVGSGLAGWDIDEIRSDIGETIWSGQMPVERMQNREVTTGLPIDEVLVAPLPGVYLVVATVHDDQADDYNYYEDRATQWVIMSDIGLTGFMGADGLHVAVRSLLTGAAMADVEVELIARNNDVLGRADSDAQGMAHFPAGLTMGQGGLRPGVVQARVGNEDFAFLSLVGAAFDLSDRGVDGRAAPGPIDGYFYTERGVYRPGEEVYVTGLLRDADARAMTSLPLTVSLLRPDGIEIERRTLSDQGLGGYSYDYMLSASAPSGTWTLQAFVDPDGAPVGEVSFQVEDFVPVRIRLGLTPDHDAVRPGETTTIDLSAQYLYGAAAAGLPGEATVLLRPAADPWPRYPGYRFGMEQESFEPVREPLPFTDTDDDGRSRIYLAMADLPDTTLQLEAVVRVSVFDVGGRPVNDSVTLPVRSDRPSIGIRPQFDGAVEYDSPAGFDIIMIDGDGARISGTDLRYELVKEEYRYYWWWRGSWDYEFSVYDVPQSDGVLSVSADAPSTLTLPTEWGRYRLDVFDPVSGAASSMRFIAGWWVAETLSDTPDQLDIAFDRSRYAIGDVARIAVDAPFAGEMLLVIANDGIIESRNVTVPDGGTVVEFAVTEDWGVGAYALATLYRAGEDANPERGVFGPGRAVGVSWMAVDMSERTLDITMATPEVLRPREIFHLDVAVDGIEPGEQAFMTVAAVDEGILLLTRFQSPDAVDYFYGQRRLGVEMRDLYGRLIVSEGRRGQLRFGGDGMDEARLDDQSTTPPVRTVRTVALFTGIVPVGPNGRATIPLEIPDYNGELRLMAVAWTADAVGSASQPLTVRDPVVSEVALPRVLAPSDRAEITLSLHNVDGPAGTYRADLRAYGPVAVDGTGSFQVALGTDDRFTATVALAADTVGIGDITLELSGPAGFSVTRSWQIAVRPSQPYVTDRIAGLLEPGQTLLIDDALYAEYLPDTAELAASFSTRPNFDVPGLVRELDQYPYGCIEQVTSRAMPLLYLSEVAEAWGDDDERPVNVDERIRRSIAQLMSNQSWSGAFSRWNPYGSEDAWLTAYAMDFLTRAREEGHRVPERAYQRGLDWLSEYVTWYDTRQQCRPAAAYALYTLSRAGQADIGDLRYYADTCMESFQTSLARGQLGVALADYGDRARSDYAFGLAGQPRVTGVSLRDYGSELRDDAALVALMAEAGIRDQRWFDMAESAALGFSRARYTSTQENAWLLLAAHALLEDQESMTLAVDGVTLPATTSPVDLIPSAADLAEGMRIGNAGESLVQRTVTIRGVPDGPRPAEANGMTIVRTFSRADGTPFDPATETLTQNDLVVVVIEVLPEGDFSYDMLIVDLIPAGLEIENPRIGESRGLEELAEGLNLSYPEHVEMRDDRFVAAIESSGMVRVAYLARAVTPGDFVLPPSFVEDMYTPELNARTGMGRMVIEAR